MRSRRALIAHGLDRRLFETITADRARVRAARLTEGQQAVLRAMILRGPDPARYGVSSSTRAAIAELIGRDFGHRYHVSSLSKILRALGFSRRKSRSSHPTQTGRPKRSGLKKLLSAALAEAARAYQDKRTASYFQDEVRFGQKGRCCRRWWLRGLRPIGPVDQRGIRC